MELVGGTARFCWPFILVPTVVVFVLLRRTKYRKWMLALITMLVMFAVSSLALIMGVRILMALYP